MSYSNVTASGPANISKGASRKIIIQTNKALTGSIILSDETATAGTPLIGTLTNPTVGTQYEYWDIKNGVTVNPSVATDVTVSISSGAGSNQ